MSIQGWRSVKTGYQDKRLLAMHDEVMAESDQFLTTACNKLHSKLFFSTQCLTNTFKKAVFCFEIECSSGIFFALLTAYRGTASFVTWEGTNFPFTYIYKKSAVRVLQGLITIRDLSARQLRTF